MGESDKLLRKYANTFHTWISGLDKQVRSDVHICGAITQPIQQVLYARSESLTSHWFHMSSAIQSWSGNRISARAGNNKRRSTLTNVEVKPKSSRISPLPLMR